MTYGYFASPARSEPTPASRSFGLSADVLEYVRTTLRARPTRSVPSSFPVNRSSPRDKPRGAALVGLGLGLPSTLMTRVQAHPSPERPVLRRQADYRLGTPFTAVPVRSMRRRVAAAHPFAPVDRTRSVDYPRGPALRIDMNNLRSHEEEASPQSAIAVTLADAFEESDGDDDRLSLGEATGALPRYSFLPPGLSSPVPWPSSPVSPNEPPLRPMTIRRLAGPGMRAPGNVTPPGAPLSPSLSRFGTHHHYPGLDHSPGGDADEDGVPTHMATHTRTVRPPRAPRLPSIQRFERDPLYQ
ncbi:hypothetical protein PYCCODRAFT_1425077 [Trametes coccinea BRFM310]|uniref:Uncharacterized protein n=1 Tax=Trametes coccinea (strain BRFM310) TaxID=1353009 RepID=A0A1Y2IP03_TRAC3|nr:hypothetical protein PYCCODRAFT_1425077 [Trametes coccinea BRFM310]